MRKNMISRTEIPARLVLKKGKQEGHEDGVVVVIHEDGRDGSAISAQQRLLSGEHASNGH